MHVEERCGCTIGDRRGLAGASTRGITEQVSAYISVNGLGAPIYTTRIIYSALKTGGLSWRVDAMYNISTLSNAASLLTMKEPSASRRDAISMGKTAKSKQRTKSLLQPSLRRHRPRAQCSVCNKKPRGGRERDVERGSLSRLHTPKGRDSVPNDEGIQKYMLFGSH